MLEDSLKNEKLTIQAKRKEDDAKRAELIATIQKEDAKERRNEHGIMAGSTLAVDVISGRDVTGGD